MRLGKIYFSNAIVEGEDMVRILRVLEFVPYRVEHMWHNFTFEYVGISPLFDIVPEGGSIPSYIVHITPEEVSVERNYE